VFDAGQDVEREFSQIRRAVFCGFLGQVILSEKSDSCGDIYPPLAESPIYESRRGTVPSPDEAKAEIGAPRTVPRGIPGPVLFLRMQKDDSHQSTPRLSHCFNMNVGAVIGNTCPPMCVAESPFAL
jgi:hypothetical protein